MDAQTFLYGQLTNNNMVQSSSSETPITWGGLADTHLSFKIAMLLNLHNFKE